MAVTAARGAPRVVRTLPGRLRVHLPAWDGALPGVLAGRLEALDGVIAASATPATRNALLEYDPGVAGQQELLDAVAAVPLPQPADEDLGAPTARPRPRDDPRRRALQRGAGRPRRALIAVRGIDRDPRLARRVLERLRRRPDVRRVHISATTGRVLVEFSQRGTDVDDILAEIAAVELPEVPGEDDPAHPLDPAPIIQSSARLVGALAGLGLIAARRILGHRGEPSGTAAVAAAVVGVAEGLPPVRAALRAALGHDGAQLALGGAAVLTLTASASPLGLVLTGATALRLLTEARARRAAWREYVDRLSHVPSADVGDTIRLEAGDRAPMRGRVVEGTGTAIGRDALPDAVVPGSDIEAGARVFGGPLVVELVGGEAFSPPERPVAAPSTPVERYVDGVGIASLGAAALTLLATRSPRLAFTTLLLVNPRPGIIGADTADTGAAARVLRAGVTVVGTRPERVVRRPDVLVIDSPRVVTDGFELAGLMPLAGGDRGDLAEIAAAVAGAAGSPWGAALRATGGARARDGRFDGETAVAEFDGVRYELGPSGDEATAAPARDRSERVLVLRHAGGEAVALVTLRPRMASGLRELVDRARALGTEVVLVEHRDRRAARAVGQRARVPLEVDAGALDVIRDRQRSGARVALVADGAHAAEAFAAADLGIALTSGRSGRFPARADLLAPDLSAVAAILDAGGRRERAVWAAIAAGVAANAAGIAFTLRGRPPGLRRASLATYIAALGAIAAGWLLLRGGTRSRSVATRLVDPRPERWGRRSVAEAMRDLDSAPGGLSSEQAAARRSRPRRAPAAAGPFARALAAQLRSPLAAILGAGAALSLAIGAVADVPIIASVIVTNAAVGAWQERQSGRAAEALKRTTAAVGRVLRDGEEQTVAAAEIVPGDVLVLSAGDRVVADARVLEAEGFEVDEAALTGESLPVRKEADGGPDAARVVLEGSDVTVGRARAVVVAVGAGTRLGATAAALEIDEPGASPLSRRLARLLRQSMPVIVGGGVIVALSGLLRRRPPLHQLALGASAAIAAVPEGLPLLSGVAETAVARRLAGRRVLVRRLAAVEALGRADVACFDKTGTLTAGQLAVTRVTGLEGDARLPGPLPPDLRAVLSAAAIASPHPGEDGSNAHPTDTAVLRAAEAAGLGEAAMRKREREAPFEPTRAFHAAQAGGDVFVKGAAEVVAGRLADERGREQLLALAERLATEGLRVLMVARGAADTDVSDPRGLVALGVVGISDPLRRGVGDAVRRCREAGVRPVMLTGDHPATARAIAREAGLAPNDHVLTGAEFAQLDDAELDERLDTAEVIARITPLDKLRIVESLQRRGHTVAMTGDGVNDAPALRLADVGVAMGRHGTEVARQAADVVLGDDELATLVEALVEGRGFWGNMRNALALLLGGNLGELGLIAGASALGGSSPMTTRQILTINLVTDVLPAVAVAVQEPEHRRLSALAREGTTALDAPLRDDILRRGMATAAPSLAAYLIAVSMRAQATTVAFASVVTTQLAQTIDIGRTQGRLSASVLGAVAASGGILAATLAVPALRGFLGLALPGPAALALIGAASLAAVALSRVLPGAGGPEHVTAARS